MLKALRDKKISMSTNFNCVVFLRNSKLKTDHVVGAFLGV